MLAISCLCSIILAGEGVQFGADHAPRFTARQIARSSDATRAGLARVAATEHGRRLIEFLNPPEYQIQVVEDANEGAIGRAPQPGIAVLVAAGDHAKAKSYELILNPTFFQQLPQGMEPLPEQPASPADAMALAWAGELLHIYFYAQGISLPHHPREDFQDDWRDLAAELGMPTMNHDDGDEGGRRRRRTVVRFTGGR